MSQPCRTLLQSGTNRASSVSSLTAWALVAVLVIAVGGTGCGKSNEPLTASSSQYQTDDESSASGGDANGAASAAGQSAEAPPVKPPSKPPVDGTAQGGAGRGQGAGGQPGAPGDEPPLSPPGNGGRTPAAAASPEKIPDGTPEELLAFLGELDQRQPSGRSNQELLQNIRTWLATRLAVADKILASKGTDDQRLTAARAKREILIGMTQAGLPNVEKQMTDFCAELAADKSPKLSRLGLITQLELSLATVLSGAAQETGPILEKLAEVLKSPEKDGELFNAVAGVAVTLQQSGFPKEALTAFESIQDSFKDTKDEEIGRMLPRIAELSKLLAIDFDAKRRAAFEGTEGAAAELLAAIQSLLKDKPGPATLSRVSMAAQESEHSRNYELAGQIYEAILAAFKDTSDAELAEQAKKIVEVGQRRAGLVGKPFVVEGKLLDGEAFDWKPYEGKIVLIDFWATWCGPCIQEIPNIKANYTKYHDKGFEVIGVNLDQERAEVNRFFSAQKLPWTTVVDAEALAERCGVEAIPFVMLIGRDGRVLDLHVRGERLGAELEKLLGDAAAAEKPAGEKPAAEPSVGEKPAEKPAAKPAEEKPAADKPADEKPAADKPAEEKPAADKPAEKPAGDQSRFRVPTSTYGSFVGDVPTFFTALVADDSKPAAKPAAAVPSDAAKGETAEQKTPKLPDVNPYAPRADLSPLELTEFILKMQEKPLSIQQRTGFAEAIVIAADRILAAKATDKQQLIAISAKLEVLHRKAFDGDQAAEEQLNAAVDALAADQRPAVAKAVKFHQLERRVIAGEGLAPDKLAELLAEVQAYCEKETLEARHLRLASSVVRLINQLEDGDTREQHFKDFGNLFAKSSDKDLARYGKKLAKPPETKESDLVGKPLEIAGTTLNGDAFDWKAYRGKAVIVDFWATWCGPCVREMPNVKAAYEKYQKKGFEIVGVSLDQDIEALASFVEEHKIPWSTLAGDGTQELAQKYGVRGIPTLMLVDKDGKVVAVSHRIEQLIPELEKLLGK